MKGRKNYIVPRVCKNAVPKSIIRHSRRADLLTRMNADSTHTPTRIPRVDDGYVIYYRHRGVIENLGLGYDCYGFYCRRSWQGINLSLQCPKLTLHRQ